MSGRTEILEMMRTLKLGGMRAAYDEIVSPGVKRNQGVELIVAALLRAEIEAKQARSINYQMTIAKLPLAKELAELDFERDADQRRTDHAAQLRCLPRRAAQCRC